MTVHVCAPFDGPLVRSPLISLHLSIAPGLRSDAVAGNASTLNTGPARRLPQTGTVTPSLKIPLMARHWAYV